MQATLSSKGQLVIPADMRRRLRLDKSSKVEIEERDGALVVRPVGISLEEMNRRRLAEATDALRASAKASGADKLTMRQINAIIAKTRKERRHRFSS